MITGAYMVGLMMGAIGSLLIVNWLAAWEAGDTRRSPEDELDDNDGQDYPP